MDTQNKLTGEERDTLLAIKKIEDVKALQKLQSKKDAYMQKYDNQSAKSDQKENAGTEEQQAKEERMRRQRKEFNARLVQSIIDDTAEDVKMYNEEIEEYNPRAKDESCSMDITCLHTDANHTPKSLAMKFEKLVEEECWKIIDRKMNIDRGKVKISYDLMKDYYRNETAEKEEGKDAGPQFAEREISLLQQVEKKNEELLDLKIKEAMMRELVEEGVKLCTMYKRHISTLYIALLLAANIVLAIIYFKG